MVNLIKKLKELCADATSFSCFAINNKRTPIVGTKIELTNIQLKNFMDKTVKYLCDRVYANMSLGEYPAASPKEYIETIGCDDERISKCITEINRIIGNPETNIKDYSKYNAYMVVVNNKKETAIFITKKKIIQEYKNSYVFLNLGDEYEEHNGNFLRLVMHFDCFIFNNVCYIVTKGGRTMLNLEETLVKKSNMVKSDLVELNLVDEKNLDEYIKKPGHSSCLANVDQKIVNVFTNITEENKEAISKKYQLPIIEENGKLQVDTSSIEKMKAFIDTITNKRAKNFDDDIVLCTAPFIKE